MGEKGSSVYEPVDYGNTRAGNMKVMTNEGYSTVSIQYSLPVN
jgi:hypothetical protein